MASNAANQAPTFDSEFDTLDVSGRGQWTPNMPWATADGRNEDDPSEAGFYVNPNFAPLASASPLSVTNGVLDLATKPVPAGVDPSLVDGKPYVSGLLQTAKGFSQLYGYFEMRAELPAGNGVGAAFWLLPEDGSWPPELDVMESLGQDPSTVYQTVHGGTSSASVPQQQVAATVAGGAASGFHTYGVDWEADKITFYVDGKQTGQFDTPASMHKPMYMVLSDNSTPASDVKWGKPVDGSTKFPADFKVDYVRAYASKPDLSSDGSPASGGAAASATAAQPTASTSTATAAATADPSKAVTGTSATPSPTSGTGAPSTVANPGSTDPASTGGNTTQAQAATTAAPAASGNGETFASSARGGSLLPSGYLSTNGNQVVDAAGNPVRIASIGWYGTDGPAGSALQGLWSTSYGQILDSIKSDGFNAVRIPWSDADLNTPFAGTNQLGGVDWSQNADLKGLTTLQVFGKIVDYAGRIGLKVIFDHHTDDGSGGQQPNGLWIDKGPGTDGTDGAGVQGTVDAAKFQADWVQLASAFKGNSTVIGFDLDNEPTARSATWGGGGPTDIQKMYTDVGNAVEAADPGALVIAEGLITPDGQGGYPMTLAAAKDNPVVLNTPNKVMYSVHSYPAEIGGGTDASGPAAAQEMTDAWGYLEAQGIAPVWVGEMGSNMTSAGSQTWSKTLLGYMNGQDGAQGGPTFSGSQQPVGGSWWNIGSEGGQGNPDGNQTAWGPGHYKPEQQAVTDQMLFKPVPGSAPGGSAAGGTDTSKAASGGSGSAASTPAADAGTTAAGTDASQVGSGSASPAGTAAPATVGTGADTLVLTLSEDAYGGDAQFTVTVDGKAVGSEQSVTAAHGKGQTEAFTFKGDWSGPHVVGVTFANDAWNGSAATDRNLYIDNVTFDGATVEGETPLYGDGTASFAIGSTTAAPSLPADTLSVTDSAGGSTSVPLIAAGSRTDSVGGGTVSQVVKDGADTLTTSGTIKNEAAALGGTRKLILVNPRAMTVTGGSGADTVSANSGSNRYVAGSGSLDVTGGPGTDDFVLHAGAGSLIIEDFDAGKGDTLSLDKSLQGSLKQASDGHGGTLLSVGAGAGTIDLINHGTLSQSSIQFI